MPSGGGRDGGRGSYESCTLLGCSTKKGTHLECNPTICFPTQVSSTLGVKPEGKKDSWRPPPGRFTADNPLVNY